MRLEHIGRSSRMHYSFPAHRHNDWELILCLTGSGTTTIDNTVYPFRPGTIFLCPPGALHTKEAADGFTDAYLRLSNWDLPRKVYSFQDDVNGCIFQLFPILHRTWYEAEQPQVCDSLLDALLGLLRPALDGGFRSPFVQLLRNRIISGFTDPSFLLQEAMADIPTNSDHLRRLFKKEVGKAPHDYLTELRLTHAQQLLRREDITVSEAAYRSGFYDPLYFSRLFRKRIGTSPSKWK